ncbi:MAG TPA: DUF4288 domain-containing protein [Candidatus Limnocylindrales bacterium]
MSSMSNMSKNSGKARASKKAWFAVKSLYRSEIVGEPRVVDGDYDPDGTLVEERVILVRAASHQKALQKAEIEAERYPGQHVNPYGQLVVWRRAEFLDSFQLFDKPADGREVWSMMTVVSSATTDEDLAVQRFGPVESKKSLRRRKKFLNREFSGDVEG